MSFETSAELSLTVDEGDLRNVRQQIEDGIGTTAVGVTDGGSMSAQSAGAGSSGGGRGRRARRSMRLAETRTELLEDAVVYLEEIEDKVGGGDAGGAGGVFTELLGVAGETAGDAAIEAGDTIADTLTQVLTGTVSTALGTTISSAISNSEVAVEDTTLTVKRPGWLDELGGRDIRFSPTFEPTFDAPAVDLAPDFDLGIPDTIAVDREPLPVQRDPLPVEDVGPIPVEEVGPIQFDIQTRGTGTAPSQSSGRSSTRSFGEVLDDAKEEAVAGAAVGGIGGAAFGGVGALPGAAIGGISGAAGGVGLEFIGEGISRMRNGGRSGGSDSQRSQNVTVEVNRSPTYNTTIDPRRLDNLADRIVEEIEGDLERDIDDMRRDLDDVEADLADLQRQITNGR